jgi:hypothetical protein
MSPYDGYDTVCLVKYIEELLSERLKKYIGQRADPGPKWILESEVRYFCMEMVHRNLAPLCFEHGLKLQVHGDTFHIDIASDLEEAYIEQVTKSRSLDSIELQINCEEKNVKEKPRNGNLFERLRKSIFRRT